MRRQEGRHRVCGPQYAIDRPGLTPDLGGEPTRQYGDEGQWKAQKRRPEQQTVLFDASFDAQIRSDPGEQQHEETAANHHPKREERNDRWGPILQRDTVHSDLSSGHAVGVNQAAEGRGKRNRKEVSLVPYVWPGEQDLRRRLLIVPARLDRGHLRRLAVNYIFPIQVPEKELDRHEHRSETETHAQHDARFGVEFPTQQVPGPRRGNAEGAGDVRGKQHMGKAHP